MYYLNADFDYRNMLDWTSPDIDCLHTVNIILMLARGRICMIVGGTTLAHAKADDSLPENLSLHFCLPKVRLCLRLLFWIPSPGKDNANDIDQSKFKHDMLEHYEQDWSDMDEGWLYGEWETGPWWAFHDKVF